MTRDKKQARSRRKRRGWGWGPVRFTARMHVDLLDAAATVFGSALQFIRSKFGRSPTVVKWRDVPLHSLVMTIDADDRVAPVRRLLVRSTQDSGALVGTVDMAGRASCDDDYEHESWSALGRRRGSERVQVLARRVDPHADLSCLERMATRYLTRTDGAS